MVSTWIRHSRSAVLCTAVLLAAALCAPPAAQAHDVSTMAEHRAVDRVVHRGRMERRLDRRTRRRSAVASDEMAAATADDPGRVGRWGPVENWPVVGVHVALLPNGKVLAWDSVGDKAAESYP